MKELDGTEYGLIGGLFDNKEELVSAIGGSAINSNSSMIDIINHLKAPSGKNLWSILKGTSSTNTVGGYIETAYNTIRNDIIDKGVSVPETTSLLNLALSVRAINVGKKFATGTASVTTSNQSVTVSGLTFKPKIIIIGGKHSDPQIQQVGGIYFADAWGANVQYGVVSTSNGYRYSVGTSTASTYYVTSNGFKLRAYGDASVNVTVTWYAFE